MSGPIHDAIVTEMRAAQRDMANAKDDVNAAANTRANLRPQWLLMAIANLDLADARIAEAMTRANQLPNAAASAWHAELIALGQLIEENRRAIARHMGDGQA